MKKAKKGQRASRSIKSSRLNARQLKKLSDAELAQVLGGRLGSNETW